MPRADEPRRTVRLAAEFDKKLGSAAAGLGCSHGALLREAAELGLPLAIAARERAVIDGGKPGVLADSSTGSGKMRGARAPSISRAARPPASPPILAPAGAPQPRGEVLEDVVAARRGIPVAAARRWVQLRGVLVGDEQLHDPGRVVDPAVVRV